MRLSLFAPLLVALAAGLTACDSRTDDTPEAALTARYEGEVRREGSPAPLPDALALADLVRLPTAPDRFNVVFSEYRTTNEAGETVTRDAPVFLVEERRDGSIRMLPVAQQLPADPDRVGLFAFAPAAFLDNTTKA
ncbi:MAG TPA: hypothetical protein VF594_08715, partial [Rubricoccaceae bacterium]